MSLDPLRVAIVGSGLGGLCLAQALKKQSSITFEIFERDPRFDSRTQGYRLRIDAGGQDALARCLSPALYDRFRDTCALTTTRGRFLDPHLRAVPGRPAVSWRSDGVDRCADRRLLREILASDLTERVQFGRETCGFELDDRGAPRLVFRDGSSSARFDVVVGADGVGSAIRAQRLPHAVPVDSGAVCVFGKTDLSAATRGRLGDLLVEGTTVVFADGFAVVIDAMHFRRSYGIDDYVYWAFIGPRERLGADGRELRRAIEALTSGWAPELVALFALAPDDAFASTAVRHGPAVVDWEPNRVTLLGDAIHVMSPAGGLGANTALADAEALARWLVEVATGPRPVLDAVRAYELDMRARARVALRASEEAASRLFARD